MADDGHVVASEVRRAKSFTERSRGLLGMDSLPPSTAVLFERAVQVHTFGMRFAIDVAWVDRTFKVKHVVRGMRPWRLSRLVFGRGYALEMAAGGLPASVVKGTVLRVEEG